jgi:hypothetical protein
MIILFPRTKPGDRLAKRLSIWLFNWFAWIVPAFADCVADDVGDTYQGMLALIVALTIGTVLAVGILCFCFGLSTWHTVGLQVADYLLFGVLYHLYARSWGMYPSQ